MIESLYPSARLLASIDRHGKLPHTTDYYLVARRLQSVEYSIRTLTGAYPWPKPQWYPTPTAAKTAALAAGVNVRGEL